MLAEKSHKTFTTLVVAATTAAIVLYSEQAMANSHPNEKNTVQQRQDAKRNMELVLRPALGALISQELLAA